MRLIDPAFRFHLCVRQAADARIRTLARPLRGTGDQVEADVWKNVLTACVPGLLSDESKGPIFLHFKGDAARTDGFITGVITSERAYVIEEVIKASER